MFQTDLRRKDTLFTFNNFLQKVGLLWDNVEKYIIAGQATDDNIICLMRIACWILKDTDTYIMQYLMRFNCNNGCTKAPQFYVIVNFLPCCIQSFVSRMAFIEPSVKCRWEDNIKPRLGYVVLEFICIHVVKNRPRKVASGYTVMNIRVL